MTTTAIIVQARVQSTRLHGKVLEDIAGRPALGHVLNRCQQIPGVDTVVCAVPDESASAPLEMIAVECGAKVFRGPEHDVLARYLGAAQKAGTNVIMRVTSDCPLIDPEICGQVLALRERQDADYAANNMPPSYPYGLDCEAFTVAALEEAAGKATDAYDREHVTPWLRRAEHLKRVNLCSGNPALASHRWTLDYPEDLEFLRAVCQALPSGNRARMNDVVAILENRPDIVAINAVRSRSWR